jgi:hypothetical protein
MSIKRVDLEEPKISFVIWSNIVAAGLFVALILFKFNDQTFKLHWQSTTPTLQAWLSKAWNTFVGNTEFCTAITLISFGITYYLIRHDIAEQNARLKQSACYAIVLHGLGMLGWLVGVLKNLVVAVSH